MIEKSRYRLGEYQISEYEGGAPCWIAHHGFGKQRTGRCLIHDDILILGQSSREEDGFLKREFLERIRRLPTWDKTSLYCHAAELMDVSSGRCLDLIGASHALAGRNPERPLSKVQNDKSSGCFRVHKYRITVSENEQIRWEAVEGGDRIAGGQCFVQSGILFIGPLDYEVRTLSSHEFLRELNEASPWRRTEIWGLSLVLRPCVTAPQMGQLYGTGGKWNWRGHKNHKKRFSTPWKEFQKSARFLWPSGIKFKGPLGLKARPGSGLKLGALSSLLDGWVKGWISMMLVRLAGFVPWLTRGLCSWRQNHHRK